MLFDHHTAQYNAFRVAEELVLLEDHYATDKCADCILKHLTRIRAYAVEALHLPDSASLKEDMARAKDLAERHLLIVRESALRGAHADVQRMVEEARSLRKSILYKLTGLFELEHVHGHHPHVHSHE